MARDEEMMARDTLDKQELPVKCPVELPAFKFSNFGNDLTMEPEPHNPPNELAGYTIENGWFISPTGVPVIFLAGKGDEEDDLEEHRLKAEWDAIKTGYNMFRTQMLAPENIQEINENLMDMDSPDTDDVLFKHIDVSVSEESAEWFPYESKPVSIS